MEFSLEVPPQLAKEVDRLNRNFHSERQPFSLHHYLRYWKSVSDGRYYMSYEYCNNVFKRLRLDRFIGRGSSELMAWLLPIVEIIDERYWSNTVLDVEDIMHCELDHSRCWWLRRLPTDSNQQNELRSDAVPIRKGRMERRGVPRDTPVIQIAPDIAESALTVPPQLVSPVKEFDAHVGRPVVDLVERWRSSVVEKYADVEFSEMLDTRTSIEAVLGEASWPLAGWLVLVVDSIDERFRQNTVYDLTKTDKRSNVNYEFVRRWWLRRSPNIVV